MMLPIYHIKSGNISISQFSSSSQTVQCHEKIADRRSVFAVSAAERLLKFWKTWSVLQETGKSSTVHLFLIPSLLFPLQCVSSRFPELWHLFFRAVVEHQCKQLQGHMSNKQQPSSCRTLLTNSWCHPDSDHLSPTCQDMLDHFLSVHSKVSLQSCFSLFEQCSAALGNDILC